MSRTRTTQSVAPTLEDVGAEPLLNPLQRRRFWVGTSEEPSNGDWFFTTNDNPNLIGRTAVGSRVLSQSSSFSNYGWSGFTNVGSITDPLAIVGLDFRALAINTTRSRRQFQYSLVGRLPFPINVRVTISAGIRSVSAEGVMSLNRGGIDLPGTASLFLDTREGSSSFSGSRAIPFTVVLERI